MKLLSLVLVLFLTACGGGGGGTTSGGVAGYGVTVAGEPSDTPDARPDCSVSLYGDSILYGYVPGGRLPQPPAATLAKLNPKLIVADLSAPGDSAYRHQQAFLNDQLASRIVVLQYGINDAGQGYPYEQALRSEVQRAKSLSKVVIVTGLSTAETTPPNRDIFDGIAARIAAEERVTFGAWGAVTPATTADGLHPDQSYSVALATSLAATIAVAAPECK